VKMVLQGILRDLQRAKVAAQDTFRNFPTVEQLLQNTSRDVKDNSWDFLNVEMVMQGTFRDLQRAEVVLQDTFRDFLIEEVALQDTFSDFLIVEVV
jgi:hypothetical protein